MMMYAHGGDIYKNKNVELDFSINVNPLGMPDFVRQAAMDSIAVSARYPDSRCGNLRKAAADHYGVPEEQLIFGNGAAELLFRLVLNKKPGSAALLAPSFLEYETALKTVGADIHFFYLREEEDFRIPVEKYLDFLREKKPEMIFLCNPSNPTGTVTDAVSLKRILDFCGEQGIFAVVDECFVDFLDEAGTVTCLPEVKAGNNGLFILQAFTKSFAAAGLRAGYGFCSDRTLLEAMEASWQPWSVSIPAQAAGEASFGVERNQFLEETRSFLRRERAYLADGLRELHFTVYPSKANFLFFKDFKPEPESNLYGYCLERGILIRSCANYEGLDSRFYRVCVRSHEDNYHLLNIIRDYL